MTVKKDVGKTGREGINFIERKMLEDAEELVKAGKLPKGKLNKARALKNDDTRFERILALIQEARGIEPTEEEVAEPDEDILQTPKEEPDEEEETEEELVEKMNDLKKLGDDEGAMDVANDIMERAAAKELDEELAKTGRYIPASIVGPILLVAKGMARQIDLWNGHDEFVRSVDEQFNRFDHLTFKQVRALVKILERYHSRIENPNLLTEYNRAQKYVKLFKAKTKNMD